MKPYLGAQKDRFIVIKKDLLAKLGEHRMMYQFLKKDLVLEDSWWNKPYKAEPHPGQHLANRAMSLAITLIDLLILGDQEVAQLVPGTVGFAQSLDPNQVKRRTNFHIFFYAEPLCGRFLHALS
jgi:hypothetical protein